MGAAAKPSSNPAQRARVGVVTPVMGPRSRYGGTSAPQVGGDVRGFGRGRRRRGALPVQVIPQVIYAGGDGPWYGPGYGPAWMPTPNTQDVSIYVDGGADQLVDNDWESDGGDDIGPLPMHLATGDITIALPGTAVPLADIRTYTNPFQYTLPAVVNTWNTGCVETVTAEDAPTCVGGASLTSSVPTIVTKTDWTRVALAVGIAGIAYVMLEGKH